MKKITKMNVLFKIIHAFKIPIWPNATDAKVFANILTESFNMTPYHPVSLKVA